MIDPIEKRRLLTQAQNDAIAKFGEAEFLRRLNAVTMALYECLKERFREEKIAITAMALDAMSDRILERAQQITRGRNAADA